MAQHFAEYMGQLAQADSISFKLIDGDGQILFAPFNLGEDFIVGYTAKGETGERAAIRYAAIAKAAIKVNAVPERRIRRKPGGKYEITPEGHRAAEPDRT
jgi:hypothetical protein